VASWNLWHGCHKISEGCQHCYVYRSDARHGVDSSQVHRTKNFDLPIRRSRNGDYKIHSGELVYTCFTSDFFLPEADQWRADAWKMIRQRPDLRFFFITKRIERFWECIPSDWGEGYANVGIGCTTENQVRADQRLPIFLEAPIAFRSIICEPLLGPVHLEHYLSPAIDLVVAGGESGPEARACDYEWVMSLREACLQQGVPFHFKQTGANFIKDKKHYKIPRPLQHSQAHKANIDLIIPGKSHFFAERSEVLP